MSYINRFILLDYTSTVISTVLHFKTIVAGRGKIELQHTVHKTAYIKNVSSWMAQCHCFLTSTIYYMCVWGKLRKEEFMQETIASVKIKYINMCVGLINTFMFYLMLWACFSTCWLWLCPFAPYPAPQRVNAGRLQVPSSFLSLSLPLRFSLRSLNRVTQRQTLTSTTQV